MAPEQWGPEGSGQAERAEPYLRAGVGGFINKRRPSHEVIEAIRKVHAGGRYITPTLAEFLFEHQIDVQKGPADLLSDREMDRE